VQPPIEYARSGDVHVAYQVVGEGRIDLVIVHGWVFGFEHMWAEASARRFLEQLASRYRVILFDKRGTGLSDRVSNDALPDIETRMDDVRAVMDAAGSTRAALFAISEGGALSCVFAATHPHRTHALILHGAYARQRWAPDYPWGDTDEAFDEWLAGIETGWGNGDFMRMFLRSVAPTIAGDQRVERWWIDACRRSASPGAAIAYEHMIRHMDVRDVLPAIHVPTLVLTPRGGGDEPRSRHLADHIPGAELVVFDGVDHIRGAATSTRSWPSSSGSWRVSTRTSIAIASW
jgi:pimeloyl-ACP methyl ester carboxylesterase